jgi:hypothetical protein
VKQFKGKGEVIKLERLKNFSRIRKAYTLKPVTDDFRRVWSC